MSAAVRHIMVVVCCCCIGCGGGCNAVVGAQCGIRICVVESTIYCAREGPWSQDVRNSLLLSCVESRRAGKTTKRYGTLPLKF